MRLRGITAIVVDDDMAALVARFVADEGGTAEAFTGLAAARERLAEDPDFFDVAIVDLFLNGKGSDLIREIRLTRPGLPCVLLSGASPQDVMKEDLACVFLPKPISHDSLSDAILEVIGAADTEPPR